MDLTVLNSKVRYLLVIVPILVITLFALAYQNLSVKIEESLLREKFVEKQQSVELLAAQIDAYVETPAYQNGYGRFELILSAGLAKVDAQAFTYAALYDEALDNVSARTPSYSSAFEPVLNTEFSSVVFDNESGTYIMVYAPEDGEPRDMHIYYRWIPTGTNHADRYLAIVAVSKYSIESTLPAAVWILPMVSCGVTTIFISIACWLLCYLGNIYVSRKGVKWRGGADDS